ncbi:hypothetical protein STCU_08612 [Strigomonas culicis]|uniref:Uncharacterized protein n=2 Tax=Strigomonas culicis TaxID=28005 RepID=S9V304_9TRYP|nr:hypothetical protein STCU_08612 [Strigomonas culicis]|eukprot:EPY21291.1 hypothetical protein STCU_08612 [Strigomonas culicis]
MAATSQTLSTILATDMNYYAGDPQLLRVERYANRIEMLLQSQRSDLLTARVAIHAQLREAFAHPETQRRLEPFLNPGENMNEYVTSAKSRAKFFSRKQQQLQTAILQSAEQEQLKAAHGALAAWERENAVLLRHQMFMTYMPSQALLLESAATVALYRQYATLEEGEYTSESSEGEVPDILKRMGGNPKPYFTQSEGAFEVDEHTKMFSQQVLQNKRVEYEQLRGDVAELRSRLEQCPTVKRLEDFVRLRSDIFAEFGIDRLVSLCWRRDRQLANPNEGGVDSSLLGLPSANEFVESVRVAQYSLPKIVEATYKNYQNILTMDDWDAMVRNTDKEARELMERLKPLRDKEIFRYWFLACLTADCPSNGPNKIVGKNTGMEEYKKFWLPQKSSYLPSITPNRATFAAKVAALRCLPHIVVLSPATYRYRENNDPNSLKSGTVDLMVYDTTNEKVLLMVANSTDARRPRGAYLNAQEDRYRLAAVVRAAVTYENQYHGFQCSGFVAEYFFDPEEGPEENYYCVMAPQRVYRKTPVEVDVPIKAFRPFTSCPPRYYLLGSNWGVSAGTPHNPYPASFAHMELNEDAIAVCDALPDGFVAQHVLPGLKSRAEGMEELEAEKRRKDAEGRAALPLRTPRTPHTSRSTASAMQTPRHADPLVELEAEEGAGPREEEDPLSPLVADDVLNPVREHLLRHRRQWQDPVFTQARAANKDLRALPAVKDGQVRTPLGVFNDMMKERYGEEQPPMSSRSDVRNSARTFRGAESAAERSLSTANVAWF